MTVVHKIVMSKDHLGHLSQPQAQGRNRADHSLGEVIQSFCEGIRWWELTDGVSRSVVSDSLWPHGLQPARLLCPWDSPGRNTGVDCHSLLQGIFPAQGSNLGLLHCRWILYPLNHASPTGLTAYKEFCFIFKPHELRKTFLWVQICLFVAYTIDPGSVDLEVSEKLPSHCPPQASPYDS